MIMVMTKCDTKQMMCRSEARYITDQEAVARSLESGENWQKETGLSSPTWLAELLRC